MLKGKRLVNVISKYSAQIGDLRRRPIGAVRKCVVYLVLIDIAEIGWSWPNYPKGVPWSLSEVVALGTRNRCVYCTLQLIKLEITYF